MTEPMNDLDTQILGASLDFIAALRARPRDQQRIDDARTTLNELIAQRDATA